MKQAILNGNLMGSVSRLFKRRQTGGVHEHGFTGDVKSPWYGSVPRHVPVCTLMRAVGVDK